MIEHDVKVAVLHTKVENLKDLTEEKLDHINEKLDVLFSKIDRIQVDLTSQSADISKLMERENFSQSATAKNTKDIEHLSQNQEKLQRDMSIGKGALFIIGLAASGLWDIIKAKFL